MARVVLEGYDGELSTAFKVKGYPSVLMVAPGPDGRLLVTADTVDLNQAVLAAAA